ncbi:MAG: DDE-type integrase/transposase/recombinase [Succinivibrionaceae bacterium]
MVNRDFYLSAPNEKWLTYILEFATTKGKLYLLVVRDSYSDEIIAYKIGNKPNAALANDTLSEAIKRYCSISGKTIFISTENVTIDGLFGYRFQQKMDMYVQCQRMVVV